MHPVEKPHSLLGVLSAAADNKGQIARGGWRMDSQEIIRLSSQSSLNVETRGDPSLSGCGGCGAWQQRSRLAKKK